MVQKLFAGVIFIVIGLTLIPVVFTTSSALTSSGGALAGDATMSALVGLLPIVFVIALVTGAIGLIVYRNRGQ